MSTCFRNGNGTEFLQHINYVPGDELRYVDWKLYSRLGLLQTKKFSGDLSLSVTILVDTSRSMAIGSPSKFERALEIAAGLSSIFLKMSDQVSLLLADRRLRDAAPACSGRNRLGQLIQFLESAQPDGNGTDFFEVFREIPVKRAGPIWILSDFYDSKGVQKAFELLRWNKFYPIPVRISDRSEQIIPFRGRFELADIETGEKKICMIGQQEAESYKKRYDDYTESLRLSAQKIGIPFYELPTEMSTKDFLAILAGGKR